MYLPNNCDALLSLPFNDERINSISANRERTVMAVVTDSTIYFYLNSHHILLCSFKRSDDEITKQGAYNKVYWRHNSKSVCIITFANFVYVYSVEISQDEDCFNLTDFSGDDYPARQSSELYLKQRRPRMSVSLAVVAKFESRPHCVVSLKDELFVSLADGWIHRLNWDGDVLQQLSLSVRNIPFSADQISARTDKFTQSTLAVVDLVYCPLIGGLCAVLNDGRAALLVAGTPHFRPDDVCAVWATGLSDALCCAANHKFRLVYFGCRNGDIAGYSLDDSNGALIQIFRIKLTARNGTENLARVDGVRQIQCVANGGVFAAVWQPKRQPANVGSSEMNALSLDDRQEETKSTADVSECPPVVAIFSPFGAQWWSSLENVTQSKISCIYTAVDWGPDGYQLWLGTHGRGLSTINFVRSLPDCRERVAMVGGDRIYLSPLRFYEQNASAPHFVWEVCKVPHEYIASNWPLRYVGMDQECNRVLVAAGTRGFCFCFLKNFRWRLFRKEAQEQDLCLTADIIVYKEFVIVAVCNTQNEAEAICAFDLSEQLDRELAALSLPVSRVINMSLSQDYLITFDVASVVTIYALKQTVTVDTAAKRFKYALEAECFAEIRVSELLPHSSCVVSVQLTQLHYHTDMAEFCPGYDSLLINVSGHLLLLSPLHTLAPTSPTTTTADKRQQENTLQLHRPTLIASNVERVWTHLTNRKIPHLNKALWINTGCRKMQIWLPLSQKMPAPATALTTTNLPSRLSSTNLRELDRTLRRSFIAKRIMLPIDLNLYPLTIDEDCLACGAESFIVGVSTSYDKVANNGRTEAEKSTNSNGNSLVNEGELVVDRQPALTRIYAPVVAARSLIRITEVFLHHLLKQLLRRNLGSYALAIASACRPLPYFGHVLELLLHDVLDEEATSSEPIPDPLLPTVVAFIHEFPEYLQTVVHCARKTELAFWNLLFSVSHHPRDIFKKCVEEGDLDTAISCLILFQSVEPLAASAQFSAQLLEETLNKRRWALARDIVRFMHSIDRSELEVNLESPPVYQKLSSRSGTKQKCNIILSTDSSATDELMFSSSGGSGGGGSAMVFSTTAVTVSSVNRQSSENGTSPLSKTGLPNVLSVSTQSAHLIGSTTRISPNSAQFSSVHSKNSTVRLLTKNLSMDSGNFSTGVGSASSGTLYNFPHFDDILMRHGAALLEDYALRDFGAFASHLSVDLKAFFANPQNAFKIPAEEFPLVLMKFHAQFAWPYPMTANGNAIFVASQMRHSVSSCSEFGAGGSQSTDQSFVQLTPNHGQSAFNETAVNGTPANVNVALADDGASSVCSFSTTAADTVSLSSTAEHNFSWKVFEKLSSKSSRGTKQSEAELVFLMEWLAETDALEWIYLLCILKQDARRFNEKLLTELNNQKRLTLFLKNVRDGTVSLLAWAEAKCPAYTPVIRVFKEFLDG